AVRKSSAGSAPQRRCFKTTQLIGNRTATVADNDFELREIVEHVRIDQTEYRNGFFIDKVDGVRTPLRARASAMNMCRHVQLTEFFIERVPVAVAERRCFRAAVFVWIGIQKTPDKTYLLHPAFEFGNGFLNRISRRLR